jgi:hypothetical protein
MLDGAFFQTRPCRARVRKIASQKARDLCGPAQAKFEDPRIVPPVSPRLPSYQCGCFRSRPRLTLSKHPYKVGSRILRDICCSVSFQGDDLLITLLPRPRPLSDGICAPRDAPSFGRRLGTLEGFGMIHFAFRSDDMFGIPYGVDCRFGPKAGLPGIVCDGTP